MEAVASSQSQDNKEKKESVARRRETNLKSISGDSQDKGKQSCCCAPESDPLEQTLATIEKKLFENARSCRYLKWNAVSEREMDAVYAYFQHPLRLEPELEFWLWDNGAALKEADYTLREERKGALWHDVDWTARGASSKASSFLDRQLTKPQLIAILNEISKVPKLNDIQAGWWFMKTPMFRTTGEPNGKTLWKEYQESQPSNEEKNINESGDKTVHWVEKLFEAFKENVVEAPWDDGKDEENSGDTKVVISKALPDQIKRKGALFFNKRRNLTKTTRSIEDQVRELTKSQQSTEVRLDETKKSIEGRLNKAQQDIAKILELLEASVRARTEEIMTEDEIFTALQKLNDAREKGLIDDDVFEGFKKKHKEKLMALL